MQIVHFNKEIDDLNKWIKKNGICTKYAELHKAVYGIIFSCDTMICFVSLYSKLKKILKK